MAQLSCNYPPQWEINNKQPQPWHSSVTIILCSKKPTTNWSHGTAQLLLTSTERDQQLTRAMAQLSCNYPPQWEINNKQPKPWHSSVSVNLHRKRPTTNNQSHGTALLLSTAVSDQQLTTWAMAQLLLILVAGYIHCCLEYPYLK
jgi:hypothetical protein